MDGARSTVNYKLGSGVIRSSVIWIALCVVAGGCQTTVSLWQVVETPLPDAWSGASDEKIDEAIWRAGRKQSWEIEDLEPRRLRGTRRWKRFVVVVSITHDGNELRVAYYDSENLRREGGRIHRSSDTVVRQLVASIEREPLLPRAKPGDPDATD